MNIITGLKFSSYGFYISDTYPNHLGRGLEKEDDEAEANGDQSYHDHVTRYLEREVENYNTGFQEAIDEGDDVVDSLLPCDLVTKTYSNEYGVKHVIGATILENFGEDYIELRGGILLDDSVMEDCFKTRLTDIFSEFIDSYEFIEAHYGTYLIST